MGNQESPSNIMEIYRLRLLAVTFLLATLRSSTNASTQHPVRKTIDERQALESPLKDHFRGLRRRADLQDEEDKVQPLWHLPNFQHSAEYDTVFGTSAYDTSTDLITYYGTASPVVLFTASPTSARTKSTAPTKLQPGMPSFAPTKSRTDDPAVRSSTAPTNHPTLPPLNLPSFSPTTIGNMNSNVSVGASSKLSKIIFVSTFLGVYVLLGGGIVTRRLWLR